MEDISWKVIFGKNTKDYLAKKKKKKHKGVMVINYNHESNDVIVLVYVIKIAQLINAIEYIVVG